jgi:hypothetical protein
MHNPKTLNPCPHSYTVRFFFQRVQNARERGMRARVMMPNWPRPPIEDGEEEVGVCGGKKRENRERRGNNM